MRLKTVPDWSRERKKLFQQVTIGTVDSRGAPRIGAHADIGAGAKLLGPVVIGLVITRRSAPTRSY